MARESLPEIKGAKDYVTQPCLFHLAVFLLDVERPPRIAYLWNVFSAKVQQRLYKKKKKYESNTRQQMAKGS